MCFACPTAVLSGWRFVISLTAVLCWWICSHCPVVAHQVYRRASSVSAAVRTFNVVDLLGQSFYLFVFYFCFSFIVFFFFAYFTLYLLLHGFASTLLAALPSSTFWLYRVVILVSMKGGNIGRHTDMAHRAVACDYRCWLSDFGSVSFLMIIHLQILHNAMLQDIFYSLSSKLH